MTTILITGGHSGIGLAAATELGARKVDLVLAGRSPDRMQAVADELRAAHGVAVTTLALNLSCLASVRAAARQLSVTKLDALLCNAGGRFDGDVTFSPDGYETGLHRRLRKAGSAVSSIAYDPGSVPEIGFLRGMPRPVQIFSTSRAMNWVSRRVGITDSDVAFSGASLAALAIGPEYADASGKYFQAQEGKLSAVRSAKLSYDERRAAKLWDDSRRLVHLTPDEEPAQLR